MPDPDTLAQLFGPTFSTSFPPDPSIANPKQPQRVVEWLRAREPGVFIDYGCGDGSLLVAASNLGWRAIGVEFDAQVARRTEERTGARVVDRLRLDSLPAAQADAVHLGDLIGHLTEVNRQIPVILRLVRPGGFLLAQGPLEAGPNLFTLILRVARWLRRSARTEMPPYHVLLATVAGQAALFRRFGLNELEYSVSEVAWPAPSRVSLAGPHPLRSLGLFLLRRLSQCFSALWPDRLGNRYYYVGRWNG
jgi:SAM-dependent methyltransferase